jgi:hypothetical protein
MQSNKKNQDNKNPSITLLGLKESHVDGFRISQFGAAI